MKLEMQFKLEQSKTKSDKSTNPKTNKSSRWHSSSSASKFSSSKCNSSSSYPKFTEQQEQAGRVERVAASSQRLRHRKICTSTCISFGLSSHFCVTSSFLSHASCLPSHSCVFSPHPGPAPSSITSRLVLWLAVSIFHPSQSHLHSPLQLSRPLFPIVPLPVLSL